MWGGLNGTRTTLPKKGQACSASRLPLGGFLTQNNTRQKVCFLGPQKSCSHLVLLRGCAINHPLPDSVFVLFAVTRLRFLISSWYFAEHINASNHPFSVAQGHRGAGVRGRNTPCTGHQTSCFEEKGEPVEK